MQNGPVISEGKLRTQLSCGPGRTKQSEADGCDINLLMSRQRQTGTMTHITAQLPRYEDFSNVVDYKTALDQLIRADAAFASLPAKTRKEFENDPAQLLAFLDNPENEQQAIDMDLLAGEKTIIVPTPRKEEESESGETNTGDEGA